MVGVGTGGTITGTARYLRERSPDLVVVGADPEGSIYSGGAEATCAPTWSRASARTSGRETFDPTVVDRWVTVSDRDAFLTTRRLAQTEGILAGGSGGLALHAALQVAAEIDDPGAMIVVILPDGGRSYLSKIYSDGWMRQYGFLERGRGPDASATCSRRKRAAGEMPPLVTVAAGPPRARRGRAAARAPRLAAAGRQRRRPARRVVGAVGERGLLRHAASDPALLDATIAEVMEPPFPSVELEDPVRDAVELLVGDQQALLVTRDGHAEGVVTRTDLLEALVS